jgi:hypothetical protein
MHFKEFGASKIKLSVIGGFSKNLGESEIIQGGGEGDERALESDVLDDSNLDVDIENLDGEDG